MNSQLKMTDKDAVIDSKTESVEVLQERALSAFSFDGLSIEDESTQHTGSTDKMQLTQEDTLNQFDFSELSLDTIEKASEPIIEEDDDTTTIITSEQAAQEEIAEVVLKAPPKPILEVQDTSKLEALDAFDLGKFGLMDKSTEKKTTKKVVKEFTGEERRGNCRRDHHDRRAQARFDGSERRRESDRRETGASPWSKGYQL